MDKIFCIPSYRPKEYWQLMKYVTKDTDLRRYEGLYLAWKNLLKGVYSINDHIFQHLSIHLRCIC